MVRKAQAAIGEAFAAVLGAITGEALAEGVTSVVDGLDPALLSGLPGQPPIDPQALKDRILPLVADAVAPVTAFLAAKARGTLDALVANLTSNASNATDPDGDLLGGLPDSAEEVVGGLFPADNASANASAAARQLLQSAEPEPATYRVNASDTRGEAPPRDVDEPAFWARFVDIVAEALEYAKWSYKIETDKEWQVPPDTVVYLKQKTGTDVVTVTGHNGLCYVAFRGTQPTEPLDGLSNFQLEWVPVTAQCRARKIAQSAHDAIPYDAALQACVSATCPGTQTCVVVTGHSQGGGIGHVSAVKLASYRPLLVTFGAPPTLLCDGPVDTSRWYRFINRAHSGPFWFYDPVSTIYQSLLTKAEVDASVQELAEQGIGQWYATYAPHYGRCMIMSDATGSVIEYPLDANPVLSGGIWLTSLAAHGLKGAYEPNIWNMHFPPERYDVGVKCARDDNCRSGVCQKAVFSEGPLSARRCRTMASALQGQVWTAWWVPVAGCVAPTRLGWAGPGGSGDHAGVCPSTPPPPAHGLGLYSASFCLSAPPPPPRGG